MFLIQVARLYREGINSTVFCRGWNECGLPWCLPALHLHNPLCDRQIPAVTGLGEEVETEDSFLGNTDRQYKLQQRWIGGGGMAQPSWG